MFCKPLGAIWARAVRNIKTYGLMFLNVWVQIASSGHQKDSEVSHMAPKVFQMSTQGLINHVNNGMPYRGIAINVHFKHFNRFLRGCFGSYTDSIQAQTSFIQQVAP